MSTSDSAQDTARPSLLKLLLISFAALFFEIMIIRWVASEVRIFSFMKNLGLMACVLGLGLGCAGAGAAWKADRGSKYIVAFLVLLLFLSGVLAAAPIVGLTNMSFVFTADIFDWQFDIRSVTGLTINVLCITGLFLLLVGLFDMLGQELGRQIAMHDPLTGYGWNLAGSLIGVVAFSLLCFFGMPPAVWLAVGLASVACFCATTKQRVAAAVCSVGVIGLALASSAGSVWTPYYRVDFKPLTYWLHNNQKIEVPWQFGTVVEVNHMKHQRTVNLSQDFLTQHKELFDSAEYHAYNVPYAAKRQPKHVLVLGAGTGNDVAAALTHGAESVVAVEIDPGILEAGHHVHPQNPYADKRVRTVVNDARTFLAEKGGEKFDVIVFGHLDSHTALSVMPSVRLDNYLYTKESLEQVTRRLSDDGVAVLSFSAQPQWLQARLYQMVKQVSGQEPLILMTGFEGPNSIVIYWGPGLEPVRKEIETQYRGYLLDPKLVSMPVEVPTDDWPFLYQRDRNVPPVYLGMIVTVLLISTWFVFSRFRLRPGSLAQSAQFFFLGAGFLLLETRGMLAVAVLFGSTWLVNSIVIAILLLMALLANAAVARLPQLSERVGYIGLAVSLLIMYFAPLANFAGEPLIIRFVLALMLIGLPFIFTGIIFSKAFSRTSQPQVALGVNILGAILGGCLEYFSVVSGTASLTILAGLIYGLSYLCRASDSGTDAGASDGPQVMEPAK